MWTRQQMFIVTLRMMMITIIHINTPPLITPTSRFPLPPTLSIPSQLIIDNVSRNTFDNAIRIEKIFKCYSSPSHMNSEIKKMPCCLCKVTRTQHRPHQTTFKSSPPPHLPHPSIHYHLSTTVSAPISSNTDMFWGIYPIINIHITIFTAQSWIC